MTRLRVRSLVSGIASKSAENLGPKADPVPYPSTPHGHRLDKNRNWPELDPHRDHVFVRKDEENRSRRLSRDAMVPAVGSRDCAHA